MKYIKRLIEQNILSKMKYAGGVLVIGPKWCGKTETCNKFAKSVIKLDSPVENFAAKKSAQHDPERALNDKKPMLVDEWQIVPKLWDTARYIIDKNKKPGQFIFTGSSTNLEKTLHSGTGRFSIIEMSTLSLLELGISTGTIRLQNLFNNIKFPTGKISHLRLNQLIDLTIVGGWPSLVNKNIHDAKSANIDYLKNVIENDAHRLSRGTINKSKFELVLKSLSRNISTPVKYSTIVRDVLSSYEEKVVNETVAEYIQILKNLYIIDEIPAWAPNVRSTVRIRQAPKRIFVDPSLAIACLNLNNDLLFKDLSLFGLIFENLVLRDLKIYTNHLNGQIFHYRDNSDLEVDAIISKDGKWGAIEIKLSDEQVNDALRTLRAFRNKMKSINNIVPTFMAIITGVQSVSRITEDGIHIIPIDQFGV